MPGFQRGKITVGNSWSKVEFVGAGGTDRRQATLPEILDAGNLARLASELGEITDFIMCCGENARESVARLKADGLLRERCRILRVCHLSNLGINNSIQIDVNGEPIQSYKKSADKPSCEYRSLKQIGKDNRKLRLRVIAKDLMEQILLAPTLPRESVPRRANAPLERPRLHSHAERGNEGLERRSGRTTAKRGNR